MPDRLTNAQIKTLRETITSGGVVAPDGTPIQRELVIAVCTAALNARHRGIRYRRLIMGNADIVRYDNTPANASTEE